MDQEKFEKLLGVRFWIKHREYNKLIGMVALNEVVLGAFQSAFLSFKLDKDELNQGYMTEAVAAIVKVAFKELNLHRLEANIMPSNYASMRVVEKLEFYKEGIGKDYLYINGVWEDHIHMVLLNANWLPTRTVPVSHID